MLFFSTPHWAKLIHKSWNKTRKFRINNTKQTTDWYMMWHTCFRMVVKMQKIFIIMQDIEMVFVIFGWMKLDTTENATIVPFLWNEDGERCSWIQQSNNLDDYADHTSYIDVTMSSFLVLCCVLCLKNIYNVQLVKLCILFILIHVLDVHTMQSLFPENRKAEIKFQTL